MDARRAHRHQRRVYAALILLAVLFVACGSGEETAVVSIDFDDALANQLEALPILEQYDVKATFYVLHPRLKEGGRYFTVRDALEIQAAGHEIGGHTLTHPKLAQLSEEEQYKEVCEDRALLLHEGLHVVNFSYPSGSYNATTQAIVGECGYESARTTGGLCEDPGMLDSCDQAEVIPPADPFSIRTHGSIKRERIPDRMKGLISDAYLNGGGWVHIIFHHVCEGCDDYAITPRELEEFLSWLADERSAGHVRVVTPRELMSNESADGLSTSVRQR